MHHFGMSSVNDTPAIYANQKEKSKEEQYEWFLSEVRKVVNKNLHAGFAVKHVAGLCNYFFTYINSHTMIITAKKSVILLTCIAIIV